MAIFTSATTDHPRYHVLDPSRLRRAAAAIAAMLIAPLTATSLWASVERVPSASDRAPEALSAALAAGRLRAVDLRGREVFASDETRLGTFEAVMHATGRQEAGTALVALDPRLDLGHGCIATPLTWLLEVPEGRLLLPATWDELRAAAAARPACGT